MKDRNFYNSESNVYSKKRYPKVAKTFTQFFFKERLQKLLLLLKDFSPAANNLSFLEIGCADGVVARAVWDNFAHVVAYFEAVDSAPNMIDVALKESANVGVHFIVRERVNFTRTYDVIIELGVLNYTPLTVELKEVRQALKSEGVYICSLSGSSSLKTRIKGEEGFMHMQSYGEYEKELRKYFVILQITSIGFFIPWLWKFPALARILQPRVEKIALTLFPLLAHEKIYVLKTKKH